MRTLAISLSPPVSAAMPGVIDLKCLLAGLAWRRGLTLGVAADRAAVRALLRRCHPVLTPLPLVRLGGPGDGGYLLPDDLNGLVGCFSPGVGHTSAFEAALLARGLPCFLADPVAPARPLAAPGVCFEQVAISAAAGPGRLTLDQWVARHAPADGDLLLQMDIEGGEWPVLLATSTPTLARFRIMAVELHDLDRLADRTGLGLLGAALERLLDLFHVVHLHPNNRAGAIRHGDLVVPRVMEVTLLRRDRAAPVGFAARFPHPLDTPNCPRRRALPLPAAWYRAADD